MAIEIFLELFTREFDISTFGSNFLAVNVGRFETDVAAVKFHLVAHTRHAEQFYRGIAAVIIDYIIRYSAKCYFVFLFNIGNFEKRGAERQNFHVYRRTVGMISHVVDVRMVKARFNLVTVLLKSHFLAKIYVIGNGVPGQISECNESCVSVASCQGFGTVIVFRQPLSVYENIGVLAVEIKEESQLGEFVIAQEPRVAVKLGCKDKFTPERLKHKVIFPKVKA